jgi:hypothetical protein
MARDPVQEREESIMRRTIAVVSLSFAAVIAAPVAWGQAPAKSASPARPDPIHDFIILKDSESINGAVKTDDFTLKTKYASIPLKKKDMLAVEYRKPPNKIQDEVQIDAVTRLYGDLQPAIIKVEVNGKVLDIPKTDILAIMFMRPIETVSEATRRALGRKP